MHTISLHGCFGGTLGYYQHAAATTRCDMRFSVFLPAESRGRRMPVLWWLSGLTCTEDNFTTKAGAYRKAAELGMIVIAPDTSPRGPDVPDKNEYDLGQGAGFYLNATEPPWVDNYQMYAYVSEELPELVRREFPADETAQGIFGHSMGGHGALTVGLKNPDRYRSLSAFAPIAAPTQCPWGQKAFTAYLGDDQESWREYDAAALMQDAGNRSGWPSILIDQGLDDPFLDEQLQPERFVAACQAAGQRLVFREHAGYDHGYFFIATFIDDHIDHHAAILRT